MSLHPMHLAILTFAFGVVVDQCSAKPSIAFADGYSAHEVDLAILAVNEGSFRQADVAAIAYSRATYSPERLRVAHPRAFAVGRTDSRRWIEGLNGDLTRPDGWPESLVPWESRGRQGWEQTLQTVRRVVSLGYRPCDVRPQVWGGRTLDRRHIANRLADGFVEIRCDGMTRNAFLARGVR